MIRLLALIISCLALLGCSKNKPIVEEKPIAIPSDFYTIPLNLMLNEFRMHEFIDEYSSTVGTYIPYESRHVVRHDYSRLPQKSMFTNFYCEIIFQRIDKRQVFNGKRELVQVNYAIYAEPEPERGSPTKAFFVSWYNYDTTLIKISSQIAYTGNEWGIGKNTVVVETNLTKKQLQVLYPKYNGKVETVTTSFITVDFTKRRGDLPDKVFWNSIVISRDST